VTRSKFIDGHVVRPLSCAAALSGPLCWAVELSWEDDSARIESAAAPPSPTEEELAAAKAWQVAHQDDY
jgi:hypothetical protein